jgi:flagellin-like hook-associated protein FlgL
MTGGISASGRPAPFLRSLQKNAAVTEQALERLMTGKRINRPSDDPAGFITAEMLRGEIVRLEGELKAIGGKRSGANLKQSALGNIQNQLIELRGTLVGAADGLLTAEQRQAFDQEIAGSLEAIDKLRKSLENMQSGVGLTSGASTPTTAAVLDDLPALAASTDAQIDEVSFSRAALAAYERYHLDVFEQLARDSIVIHSEALSQVEDADFAEEASKLATSQVLAAGAIAALVASGEVHAEQIEALLDGVSEGSPIDL